MTAVSEMKKSIERYFGPSGLLAATVPDYEDRPGQFDMALSVLEAFEGSGTLIAEAPTGTGKTLAYLIPAMLFNRRVVISTNTKNLQEQIFLKDWPFLRDQLGFTQKVALMKGRNNYLCKARLELFYRQPRFRAKDEAAQWEKLQDWIQSTGTGDRAEIDWMPDGCAAWNDICSTRFTCGGSKCPRFGECFVQKMRRKAAAADILVVNHHLFFADLALKEGDFGEVIPDYHAVVFDEAHELEDVATSFFSSRISNYRIDELDRDTVRLVSFVCPTDKRFVSALKGMRVSADTFFDSFRGDFDQKYRLRPEKVDPEIMKNYGNLHERLQELSATCSSAAMDADSQDMKRLSERVEEILDDLDIVMDFADKEFVHYAESRGRGINVVAEPIQPGNRVKEALFTNAASVIFTSATLSTNGHFKYFTSRLGIDFEVEKKILPTCFDFKNQSVLYVPRDMPNPNTPDFLPAFISQALEIVNATQGRAFLLFTSIRNMREAFEAMAPELSFTCLLQGQGSKTALLDEFRSDTNSVLFATASFWQGVDVIGASLSCVIIDKLPFASPYDPVIEARIESINAGGGKAFFEYQVPQAIISLKQGLGRLIRHKNDRGLLVLTDSRVRTKGYGTQILKNLPEFPVTGNIEDVLQYAGTLEA